MPVWSSPFEVEPQLTERLQRCGWTAQEEQAADCSDDEHIVVLYPTPDQLLAAGALDPEALVAGYRQLLEPGEGRRLISTWRLQACSDAQLRLAQVPQPGALEWPSPEPLAALITRHLLDAQPALLDAYLDLELKADLLGGEPDCHYRKRLLLNLDADALLAAWRQPPALQAQLTEANQQLSDANQQLTEAREETELTLQQLRQLQGELEHHVVLQREQSTELEQLRGQHAEVQAERDALQAQLQERDQAQQQQLSDANQQLTEAREEAELTLLQLHQVQEELEHYFLLSRSQTSQLERYEQLLRRSEGLLSAAAGAR